jgi:hypothetical protein
MTELITIYSDAEFWHFNKQNIALAIVVASATGLVFGLTHELGKTLWFFIKKMFANK